MNKIRRTVGAAKASQWCEATLVAALKAREEAAYCHLVRAHGPWMLATARRLVREPDAAHDVVQEALLSVHRSIGGFERRSSLAGWLRKIVINAAFTRLRVKGRLRECALDDEVCSFDEAAFIAETGAATIQESLEQRIERATLNRMVREVIDKMPDGQRSILMLRDIEGFSTAEAAARLDISITAAKVRLHRARLALKARLESDTRQGSIRDVAQGLS